MAHGPLPSPTLSDVEWLLAALPRAAPPGGDARVGAEHQELAAQPLRPPPERTAVAGRETPPARPPGRERGEARVRSRFGPGLRGLAGFWGSVALFLGCGASVLQILGPLPQEPAAAQATAGPGEPRAPGAVPDAWPEPAPTARLDAAQRAPPRPDLPPWSAARVPAEPVAETDGAGHGGAVDAAEAAARLAGTALWERLRGDGPADDIEFFIRFYPDSRHAAAAQRRLAELRGPAQAGPAPSPPQVAQPAPPPPLAAARPAPPPPAPPQIAAPASPPPAQQQPPPPPGRDQSAALRFVPLPRVLPEPRAMPAPPAGSAERYFRDCPDCPWMARLPAGTLSMGLGANDSAARPVRAVTLRGFALGRFPVTVAEWSACAAEGGCGPPPRMAVANNSTPIHNVSWEDAQQYIAWLSRAAGRAYRLPTEAEWEYAARAGTSTRYWWGDRLGVALANCATCGGAQDPRGPMPADAFGPNDFGVHGMLGGVAQWVQDCWAPNYRNAPEDGSAREARGCAKRVLRGGSFRAGHEEITPVARGNYDAPVRYIANGFRVARDPD